MGTRPILSGQPTVEVNQSRYEELLKAEVKCEQYRSAIEGFYPELVSVIECEEVYDGEEGED